jgi:osmotically-inducible protein OsmY
LREQALLLNIRMAYSAFTRTSSVAVSVNGGVVTLAGFISSYAHKNEAKAAAKRAAGVIGVANDIEVRRPAVDERPDPV